MSNMQKRLADQGDISTLIKLRKQQLTDEGLPLGSMQMDIDSELTDYITSAISDGSFISWIMEQDGEIIATSGVCFYALPPNFSNPSGKTAYVTNMYTKPEYRRKGIATELLEMVIDEARSRGYTWHDGKTAVPTKVMLDFICDYIEGALTPSDETSEVIWVPKANVTDYISLPVLRLRFRNVLQFNGRIHYCSYVTQPEFKLLSERII